MTNQYALTLQTKQLTAVFLFMLISTEYAGAPLKEAYIMSLQILTDCLETPGNDNVAVGVCREGICTPAAQPCTRGCGKLDYIAAGKCRDL